MEEHTVEITVEGKSEIFHCIDEEAKFKFLKDLKKGIWYINTYTNGFNAAVVADKLSDLPKAITQAEFMKYKLRVAKNITAVLHECQENDIFPTTDLLIQAILRGMYR